MKRYAQLLQTGNLNFEYLPGYAEFLLNNKFKKLVKELTDLCYEMKVPMLKYLASLSKEEVYAMGERSLTLFLNCASENKMDDYLEMFLQSWIKNQLPVLLNDQLVVEDLTLASYIRKKIITKYVSFYTKDIDEALEIINELDIFNLKYNSVTFKVLSDIQQEKINEQLHLIRQNESYYKKAEAITHTGNWRWNIEDNTIIWTDELCRIYDLPVTKVLTFEEIFSYNHPDDVEKVKKSVEHSLTTKQPFDFYYRIISAEKKEKTLHAVGEIAEEENDKIKVMLGTLQDVTEAFLLRRQLEEEKSFAELLIENSPDMILVLDTDMRVKVWNKKCEEHNHISKQEILGKNWFEFFPEYDKELWMKEMQPVLNGEMRYLPKVKFLHNPGFGELYIIPLKNSEGKVFSILTIIRNITELVHSNKRYEQINEELRLSEELYHRMIDEIQDYAIIRLNKEGIIENWNKGAEKIKGYKSAEIIGKHFSVFYPEERREKSLPAKLIEQATQEGKAIDEGWRIKKDGSKFWGYTVITSLHNEKNEVIGFVKVTRDLTENKIAEDSLRSYAKQLEDKNTELGISNEQLRQARKALAEDRTRVLIETMPHIVATTKADGSLTYSNQHLMNYTGYSFDEIKQGKWAEAIFPPDLKKILVAWKRSLSTRNTFQSEFRFKRLDGQYFWHLVIAKPIMDEDNSVFMWILTFTNIHDQKMMDEKKDEFIGIASHELKTPLTSVKAYTQLLHSLLKNEKNEEALFYIKKANLFIDKLNSLISELLDITKMQHGKLSLTISEFNFGELLKETVDFMQASSPKHTIYVKGNADVVIKADKERIQQVLVNFINNAIKYSPEADKVEITVSTDENNLTVGVRDFGIGIPAIDINKVFERFYRVQDNATKFQGLGIGLFISSEIIKRHHGEIRAESELNKGSVFYFSLPLKEA